MPLYSQQISYTFRLPPTPVESQVMNEGDTGSEMQRFRIASISVSLPHRYASLLFHRPGSTGQWETNHMTAPAARVDWTTDDD